MTETVVLDELDRAIVHALRVDGRVPLADVAAVLDLPARVVARRYARLRSTGTVRVIGLPASRAIGRADWILRARADVATCARAAGALARRDDVRWVALGSGGVEVSAVVRHDDRATPTALVMPRLGTDVTVDARCLLRTVAGRDGWPAVAGALTSEQVAALRRPAPARPSPRELSPPEELLLAALARDGRAPSTALARGTGWSESTVRRRITALRDEGLLHLELDVVPEAFGMGCEAMLWLRAAPDRVAAVGDRLARHPAVAFGAVTTGATNLVAVVVCADLDGLDALIVDEIGTTPGVEHVDVVPVARHVKRAGGLLPV